MKSMQEILNSTPRKDIVLLKWVDESGVHTKKATEEQVRWLALNIAKGEFPYNKVVVSSKEHTALFDMFGRLTSSLLDSNCLSLNDDLAMDLLRVKGNIPTEY